MEAWPRRLFRCSALPPQRLLVCVRCLDASISQTLQSDGPPFPPSSAALPDSPPCLSQLPCTVSDVTCPLAFLCSLLVKILISSSQGPALAPGVWVWSSNHPCGFYRSILSVNKNKNQTKPTDPHIRSPGCGDRRWAWPLNLGHRTMGTSPTGFI